MVNTQALLLLYMACGFTVSKLKIIRADNRGVLVRLLMDVAMPMMVLDAFNKPTTLDEILSSLWVMAIALAGCVVTGAIGLLMWKRQPESKKKVLMYASMFSNAGNAGLPIISMVFGPTGVLYASMYLIPPRILQWTVGLGLFVKPEKGGWVKNVLLNPMVVMILHRRRAHGDRLADPRRVRLGHCQPGRHDRAALDDPHRRDAGQHGLENAV